MHTELDDSKVKGFLVSLGLNKLKEDYRVIETSEEDREFLEDLVDDFIPDIVSYKGVYRPNKKGIILTRHLTQGNHLGSHVADTWNFQRRNGLEANFTTGYSIKEGSKIHLPTNMDKLQSNDADLDAILKEKHARLLGNTPFNDRVTLIYNTLLGYSPTPNANTLHT